MKRVNYSLTIKSCYLSYFVLAIVINLTPILFVELQGLYGLTFGQLGFLISINFVVQVIADVGFGRPIDKYGPRPFLILSQVMSIIGLLIFALSPMFFENVYHGLVLGTAFFSVGGGLMELLINPVVSAIPKENNVSAINFLHSCYSWGQIGVVVITTALVYFLESKHWIWIAVIWVIVPLVNLILYLFVPIPPFVKEEHRQSVKSLSKSSFFVLLVLAIVMAAAAEHVMGEWSSVFLEKAVHLPKIVGDTLGVCMFAFMMGIGRIVYAKSNSKNLVNILTGGSILAAITYVLIAFSNYAAISLLACALCGFAVSIMWPGIIVLATEQFPNAGTTMHSVLAASGDIGAAFAPWLVGIVAEKIGAFQGEEIGLKTAMLIAAIFPLIMLAVLLKLKNQNKEKIVSKKE